MIFLETKRLRLRPFQISDALNMFLLNVDPDVVKYTGDKPFRSVNDSRDLIINYSQYAKFHLGRLIVELKSTGETLGWCGLKFLEEENEVDIGYRLYKKFWNQGFATEASMECLRYGFEERKLKSIIGRAMTENIASIRVFEKCGLTFERNETCDNQPAVVYRIQASSFFNNQPKS